MVVVVVVVGVEGENRNKLGACQFLLVSITPLTLFNDDNGRITANL